LKNWIDSRHLSGVSSDRKWVVRRATPADIPALARHRCEMFRDMGKLPDELHEPLKAHAARYLEAAMPRGDYVAWVAADARDDSRVIGGAGVQLRPIMPRPVPVAGRLQLVNGPEGIVLNVYTEPDWRRLGVAESLMRALLAWARANGVRPLVLHASDDGRALYERLGFVQTNEMRWNESEV